MSLNTSGTNTISAPIVLGQGAGSTATFNQASGGTLALTGDLSGTVAGISLAGSSGRFLLSGNNTYSGNTTLTSASGILNINSATAISSGALITTGSATINNTSGSAVILSNNNNLNLQGVAIQTLTFTGTNDLSFGSGVLTIEQTARTVSTTAGKLTVGSIDSLSTSTTFTKAGGGTLAITGAAGANFQGGTSLLTGGLLLGNKAALGTGLITIAPSNPTSISASTDLSGVNAITNNVLFSSAGGSTFNLSGSNNLTLAGSFTIGANKTVTVSNTAATELSGSIYLSDVAGTGYRLSLTNTIASAVLTVSGDIANYSGGAGTAGSILWTGGIGTILRLTGTNSSYTGVTGYGGTANNSAIEVTKLANGGVNSSIGASSSAASNLVIGQAGILRYVGGGDSTDRLFTLDGSSTGNYNIASSGSGAIEFTNTGSIAHTGLANAARTLYLRGSNTDDNILAPVWTNNGSGVNVLVKMEAGTWVLTGANSYTGETRMGVTGGTDAGILRLSGAGKISTAATTVFTGTLDVAATTQTITTLSLGAGASGTAANVLIGSGGVMNLGGTLAYTGTNNPNGATISGAGILNLNGNRTLAVGDSTAAAADLTVSSIIADGSSASSISKTGAGTLVLSGNNSYSGGTALTLGTLGVSHSSALGTGALTLTVGGATILQLQVVTNDVVLANDINGPAATTALGFAVSGTQNLTLNGLFNVAYGGVFTNNIGAGKLLTLGNVNIASGGSASVRALSIQGTGDTTIAGVIANGYVGATVQNIGITNTGITTFSGNNTFTGYLSIINGATLVITNVANANTANALGMSPNSAAGLLLKNVTLKYTGAAASTDRLFTIQGAADGDYGTLDGSGTGAINFTNTGALLYGTAAQTRTLNLTGTNTGNNTLAALLANNTTAATSLNKSGAGTWVLTKSNTFTGATTVTAGTLVISGTGAINNTSGIAISGSSAKLKYDSSVAMSRNVTVTSGGTFAYNSSGNYTGTLILSDGKLGGTNWNGAQLGGLTIAANQAISPGNSVGNATTTTQTWANSGSYVWEISKGNGTAGDVNGGWDLLTLSGALTISATSGTPFAINITSLGLDNQPGLATGFNSASSYNWLIADAGSAITTFSSDKFSISTADFQNAFTGNFSVALGNTGSLVGVGDNSQLYLTYTAVPEPATWALLAFSLTTVMILRRRRNS